MIKISNIISKKNRDLLGEMIRTDLKLRYQNSVLGYLWSILKPLFMFGILYVVFTQFLRFGDAVPNFAISLLLGIVLWTFFTEATQTSLLSIVERGDLIRKIKIPHYLIVVARVLGAGINLLLNLLVVFIFAFFSNIDLTVGTLLFPIVLLELTLFTLAVSFFLAAAYVRFKDVGYIWEVGLQGLFYLIPILYPLLLIPSELAQKFIMLNPLAQIIQDARATLTYPGTTTVYDLLDVFWITPFIIVLLSVFVAIIFFKKESKQFAENI